MKQEIKDYWDTRAATEGGVGSATTDDVYLRVLEAKTLVASLSSLPLSETARVLDVGCGDGRTTITVAQAFPKFTLVGVDFSESMIEVAARQLEQAPELAGRLSFQQGDATALADVRLPGPFDAALTSRCLINLPSAQEQAGAVLQIAASLRPGGYYVAIENFVEGQERLNAARKAVGLPEIPIRWHNCYLSESSFEAMVRPHFEVLEFKEFASSYYFATRVIYSAMCQMRSERPDYQHEIHRLSVDLPWFGQFSPIRMVVLRRLSTAIREVEHA